MGEKNYKPTWQHCVNLITEQNACNCYHRCGRHRPETMSLCSTFFQPSHCLKFSSTLRHKLKDPHEVVLAHHPVSSRTLSLQDPVIFPTET